MLKRVLVALSLFWLCGVVGASDDQVTQPEAGPENGGLRLRLMVKKRSTPREGGFDVKLELTNASQDKVTLRTGWESNETGDVKEYLRLHANVETYPPIEPMKGATGSREARTTPQKELTLAPGDALTMDWQTVGRKLKNESEFFAHSPELNEPGLYAVHFTLDAITATGTHRLRSNEQLVLAGGNPKQPRHTYGHVTSLGRGNKGELSLGTREQVKVGDVFEITSKTGSWRLVVAEVHESYSELNIQMLGNEGDRLPTVGAGASLVTKSAD